MTFRQMELFVLVCKHKNITKASEAGYVSQQGISKSICDLEKELGVSLLQRTQKGVMPTASGKYLLQECTAMLEKNQLLRERIQNIQNAPQEIIHMGLAFGVIAALPFDIMPTFEKRAINARIDYSDHTDLTLENALKKGDYDFILTTGVLDSDNLYVEKLKSEPVHLCIPKNHPLYNKENIKMADLEQYQFAMFTTQFFIRHNFATSCKKAGFKPDIKITSNDFNSLRDIAKINNLLLIVPSHTITIHDDGVRFCKYPDENFTWDVFFIKKESKQFSDNMTLFYNITKESVAKESV